MARRTSGKEIGRRIRAARLARGVTGEWLAEKIGTDKGTVSRIEHGATGLSTDRLQDIAAALGAEVGVLLGRDATGVSVRPRAATG